jgi:DNA invertase Pin-like site-specific DNA recombinase
MSTDHQEYSTANQKDAIAAYALERGLEIVKTYADEGRSGLHAEGRPGLCALLEDVAGRRAEYRTILVYDVSRWGRFQDTDEAAHYEFLCRRAGIHVEYCMEPFRNDGSPMSSVIKGLKRVMAGEYSRELSVKVTAGKTRLCRMGFCPGGPAPYGLRRMVVDSTGARMGTLQSGEHKFKQNDRVLLVPGPKVEQRVVGWVFRQIVNKKQKPTAIARALNRDGVKRPNGKVWTSDHIMSMLTNEKYIGNLVYCRTSARLGTRMVRTTPETWIRTEGVFEPIVTRKLFDAAHKVMASWTTLNIVAHDRFQEIIDEANRPGSAIRMQKLVLDSEQISESMVTVVSQSLLATSLGVVPERVTASTVVAGEAAAASAPVFATPEERNVARITYEVIRELESQPTAVPNSAHMAAPAVQATVIAEVTERVRPVQLDLPGAAPQIDIAAIVKKTTEMVIRKTIDIPRILVVPTGEVRSGFRPFRVALDMMKYPAPSEDLVRQTLRDNHMEVLTLKSGGVEEQRPEDYIVAGLVDFSDVSYDDQAEYLYELAGQVVAFYREYLAEDEVIRLLRAYQRPIADQIHAQMQDHYWEEATGYETRVSKGFTDLKEVAYSASAVNTVMDFRQPVDDRANIGKYVFGGFERCLYAVQKFDSDTERRLAAVLDRDALKWFKPALGQFQIYYRDGSEQAEYQPDFVAEAADAIYMIETKAANQMSEQKVLTKKAAAEAWCVHASEYAKKSNGKPWRYVLVPHDVVATNMTLKGLVATYSDKV